MKYPKKLVLIAFAVFAIAGIYTRSIAAQHLPKPNIVMIAIDDLNDWVGYLGGPALTPNIDGLANRSHQFLNAYTASPTCNASRVALLTGQRPAATGVFGNHGNFRDYPGGAQRITLPEYLRQQAGYETIEAGKIFHLPRQVAPEPDLRSDPQSWDLQNAQYVGTSGHRFYLNGSDRAFWLGNNTTGSPYYDRFLVWGVAKNYFGQLEKTWQTGDWKNADYAANYLSQSHNRPFFLAVGFGRPHLPFIAPKEHFDIVDSKYPDGVPVPYTPSDDLDDLSANIHSNFTTKIHNALRERSKLQDAVRGYLASVSFVDAAVGRVIEAVEQSQYADNTIIVLWSDHGMQFGQKQRMEKFEVWRASTHVPLLIHTPGQEVGQRLEQAASLLDVYPTITDLIDVEPNSNNDGKSLVGIMNDPQSEALRAAVVNGYHWRDVQRQEFSVLQNGWNYIRRVDGTEELYDHRDDPSEFTNLADRSTHRERKKYLATELFRSAVRVGNSRLPVGSLATLGDKQTFGFNANSSVSKLDQHQSWTTKRFGVVANNRDFRIDQQEIKSVRGRLVSTIDGTRLLAGHDFLLSTEIQFSAGGVGSGLVFGYQGENDYFEILLMDGNLPENSGKDVLFRRWSNGSVRTFSREVSAPSVVYDQSYTVIADFDSQSSTLDLKILDPHKNVYFRDKVAIEVPLNSAFGISSFYHHHASMDNIRLLVSPKDDNSQSVANTNQYSCDALYEVEEVDTFDELPTSILSWLDSGWTTQRHGADYGSNFDFIVHNGLVNSVNGRLIATRDTPVLQEGQQIHLTTRVRFVAGGHRAGIVLGFEDENNYYQFDLVDGNLSPNNGADFRFSRWVDGVERVLGHSDSQPNVQRGEEYTMIVEYDDTEGILKLVVLDDRGDVYLEKFFSILLPLGSNFGIGSYYHGNADWDYFRILSGEEVFLLNESCLLLK